MFFQDIIISKDNIIDQLKERVDEVSVADVPDAESFGELSYISTLTDYLDDFLITSPVLKIRI